MIGCSSEALREDAVAMMVPRLAMSGGQIDLKYWLGQGSRYN